MKKLRLIAEAAGLKLLFIAFRTMPLDTASWFGGCIGRAIGPFMSAHKTAEKNIQAVFPDMSATERHEILRNMWDNLGRVAAELPHLPGEKLLERTKHSGAENMQPPEKAMLFFSGHLGNWELLPTLAGRHGKQVTLVYRKANNPYVDEMIVALRASHGTNMFPKGPRGAVKMAHAIKGGDSIALLIDQKMNDGIAVPFFGREAMTAPAVAHLALRYDLPIIPTRVVRTGGAHFEVRVSPPLVYEKTGSLETDTLAIMTAINRMLESWIREYPEQWFWVHKRWPIAN